MADLIQLGMALIVSVTPNYGSDPNLYQQQSWEGPTIVEMGECATMARDLNAQFDYLVAKSLNVGWQTKTATCEIFPADEQPAEDEPAVKPASFKF